MRETDPLTDSDRHAFTSALGQAADTVGVAVDAPQIARMFAHFQRVIETNRRFNLTRITDPADAAVKHYADSLTLLACPGITAAQPLRLLDVGTGAGFPAVPLAIVCTPWHVTAIDGTNKKARFVAECAATLELTNLDVRHARALDLARTSDLLFDLVLFRAVARLDKGLREVHPLIRPGGSAVFYKTAGIGDDERTAGTKTARHLNLTEWPTTDVTFPTPQGSMHRRLIRYTRTN